MNLSGKRVSFHLSPQGREALSLVAKKASFEEFVMDTDVVGAWILEPGRQPDVPGLGMPVMLLRWDYVAKASVKFQPEQPAVRSQIGFEKP